MDSTNKEVAYDASPFLIQYKDGTIQRLAGTEVVPPGLDPETGVLSEDKIIIPQTGVSARFYRPASTKPAHKLPLVIYFHGGGFFVGSIAEPKYHQSLNKVVAESNIVLVSVDYRLAPENPLPAAYDDSWAAIEWAGAQGKHEEPWLKDYVDFEHVFLAGDSCGANIIHHLALKINGSELGEQLKIEGMAMICPYFWGKDPVGMEITDNFRKSMVDNWWMFICPSDKGCDDPLINPFTDGSPGVEGLACKRVIIIVTEKDILRDRGMVYYEKLVRSGWKGSAEIVEIKGEDHVFHIFYPNSENAKCLFQRLASFFNQV